MSQTKKTRWFIEHIGAFTNEVLAQALPNVELQELRDDKGKSRRVREVDWDFVEQMQKSKLIFPIEFRLFSLEKNREKIRDVTFLLKKKKKWRVVMEKKIKPRKRRKVDPKQGELFT